MIPPTSIDGTDITGATIDGTDVTEITVDGDTVFTAGAPTQIPAANDLYAHYDFSTVDPNQTTNIPDISGNGENLVNGSYPGANSTINGIQAGTFDNASSLFTNTFSVRNQPFLWAIVQELNPAGSRDRYISMSSQEFTAIGSNNDNGLWEIFTFQGSFQGSSDLTTQLHLLQFKGTDIFREDGQQTGSGSIGNFSHDHIALGAAGSNVNAEYYNGAIGEVAFWDGDQTSNISQIESYFANKWNITI